MSERDATDESEMADDNFEFDADIAALLGDSSMWEQPGDALADRIAGAVQSEASMSAAPGDATPRVAARRGWLRPALLGAAAAVMFVIGGIVVLSALSGVEEADTFAKELTSTGLIADVSGNIEVTSFDSGLRIDLDAPTLPRRADGAFYEGWVKTIDGDLFPVGTFHEGDDVTLWAGVELERIELFTITLEAAAPGDDPAQASSGDVVLRAAIGG